MLLAENRNRGQRYGGTFRMGPVCAVGHFLSYLKHFGGFLTQVGHSVSYRAHRSLVYAKFFYLCKD